MIESYKNFNALMYIATGDLLDEDFAFAQSFDTSETAVSEKTKRKVLRRIKNHDKATLWSELPLTLKRIVAVILIVSTVSMAMCLSVKAVREEIVNTVLEWYDKFVAVFYVTETILPTEIEVYKEPFLDISGTEKIVVMQANTRYQITYFKDGEILISYQQDIIVDEPRKVDSEHNCTQQNIKINDNDAILFIYDNGNITLTWHDNEYAYLINSYTSEISTDILILLAESVR